MRADFTFYSRDDIFCMCACALSGHSAILVDPVPGRHGGGGGVRRPKMPLALRKGLDTIAWVRGLYLEDKCRGSHARGNRLAWSFVRLLCAEGAGEQ